MTPADDRGAIGFAEKVLELLEDGRFTATYKYAVLLALMDVCLERTERDGAPPDTVTTRQLAEKIVEVYWPHTIPFSVRTTLVLLKQNTTRQAAIVSEIVTFRERYAADPSVTHWHSRQAARKAYDALVTRVEWKLIEMPLPRLQVVGQSSRPFIYEIGWDHRIQRSEVATYLAGHGGFDNRIHLRPGVGEYLLQLSGLLRPLIQRRWAAMVAHLNRLEDSQLEIFLFGADRTPTVKVRAGIWEIQDRRCFYCDAPLTDPAHAHVDHFLPWSRYPDDGLDNFVVADKNCNGWKSNSLAATEHLVRWAQRFQADKPQCGQLTDLATQTGWDRGTLRTASVARAIYLRLPEDARLWLCRKDFVAPDAAAIRNVLTAPLGQ